MLPRKRTAGGEADDISDASNDTVCLKKPYLISCAAAASSYSSSVSVVATNGNAADNSDSIMGLGDGNTNGNRSGNPSDIDEDLHSRQLAVYGRETMRRLFVLFLIHTLTSDYNGLNQNDSLNHLFLRLLQLGTRV